MVVNMTLYEMSFSYQESGHAIAGRIEELRRAEALANADERRRLQRRIEELRVILYETRELAVLTRRYYDRSYHKNGRYTL